MKNTKTPEDVKKGLECCGKSAITCDVCPYDGECHLPFCSDPESDALALIQQLEEDKKRLQERICNQRRQLRVLHAMYEWALGRLADMTELMQLAQFCRYCKHITSDGECTFDFEANKGEPWCWQWRGVQKEVE